MLPTVLCLSFGVDLFAVCTFYVHIHISKYIYLVNCDNLYGNSSSGNSRPSLYQQLFVILPEFLGRYYAVLIAAFPDHC